MSIQGSQRITVPIRPLSSEQVRRYFIPLLSPGKTIALLLAAFLCLSLFFLCFAISIPLFAWGALLLCVIFICIVVLARRKTPDDQAYDTWLKEQAALTRQTAFRELQIDRNEMIGPPVVIHSFTLPGASLANRQPEDTLLIKKGRDGQYRFSANFYTYLIPCHRYIAIYTHCVNAVAMSSRSYQNEDYSSQHIVKPVVLASQKDVLIEGEWCHCDIEQVGLGIANQEPVPLGACLAITPIDSNDDATLTLPDSNMEQTIMNIRKLLRRY